MSAEEPTYSVVRMVAGEGKGLPVLLMHVTDEDVAMARAKVQEGDLAHLAVIMVVVSFLHSLGVDPAAYSWSSGEYVALLEMLGMPPFEWSPLEDDELAQLLAEGVSRHGE